MMEIKCFRSSLVADLVRGKPVGRALNLLYFCRKRPAKPIAAVLQSAVANAENNNSMDIDRLFVSGIWVGKAQCLRRWHARARGRGARIIKHYSNVTVVVAEEEDLNGTES